MYSEPVKDMSTLFFWLSFSIDTWNDLICSSSLVVERWHHTSAFCLRNLAKFEVPDTR